MENYTKLSIKYLKFQKKRTILTILGVALASGILFVILTLYFSNFINTRDALRKQADYEIVLLPEQNQDVSALLKQDFVKTAYRGKYYDYYSNSYIENAIYINVKNPYRLDANVETIEQTYGVKITNRGTELKISGEDEAADRAGRAIEGLLLLAAKGETIDEQKVRYLIDLVSSGNEDKIGEMAKDVVCITAKGRPVKAKTLGQQRYMKAILKNTITIGVGPAGTGKTYLAVAAAVAAFREKAVNRIILTRPAVEAGERLGFLPGDLQNKVDPYLRPLYDALYDMLGAETYQKYLERGNIEVAPLAYMRGRTLDDSFIILDEAQNTTREQMKMFLTRLGFGSKIVITGDITQIDLPSDKVSGLKDAVRILDNVPDIAICRLTASDVVRHALVQRIIAAYETAEHSAKNGLPGQKKVYRRKP